jgi:uncharacterized protein (DUF1499 family)
MSYLGSMGWILSSIALLGLAVSGPGHRLGWWGFKTGITVMKYAGFLSLAAIALCLAGLAVGAGDGFPRGMAPALLGLAFAGLVLGSTVKWKRAVAAVPYIHDVTTDTEDPPSFVAVLPLRAGADNPAEYGGPDLARQQKAGYPNLGPGSLSGPPEAAFPRALQAAQSLGWEIVAADPEELRIEATDTTFWFGFKDDIVVRLTPSAAGTRVDVRSVSRVGKSDVGTNARRIERYLARLKSSVAS